MDKSEDLQTPKRRIGSMAIASYPHTFRFRFGAKETRHKGDGYYNHRFFDRKNSFHPYGRCRRLTSPAGAEDKTTTQQKSVYIDYRKGRKAIRPNNPEAKYDERTKEKE